MSNYVGPDVRRQVSERAGKVCEYCLIAEEDAFFCHQIEHIISLKHGGPSDPDNLALACMFCNLNKGSDIASVIPNTHDLIRFYNPRKDRWSEHFRLDGVIIEPLTEIGEATVRILKLNSDDRILERTVLQARGRYPNIEAAKLVTEH